MKECTPEEFATAHAAGAVVIDVREPQEYTAGHVPRAILRPLSQIGSRVHDIPADGPVYVICASGNRSKAVTDLLINAGREAYSVRGGTMGWSRAGRPLVTGTSPE
ncbi:MAG TPA: rhodanese-like domain-containing protein [Dermatophilaceae bacterium]|nr:rhodanese-like domain-containing protein [Dermatophilaceae bacterium]